MEESVSARTPRTPARLDTIAFWSLLATLFLFPIFFVPIAAAPFQFSKVIVLATGILVTLFFYTVARLREGYAGVPRSSVMLAVLAIPVAYGLSSFFSGAPSLSLFGYAFEIDTFGFVALMVFFFYVTAVMLRSRERILQAYFALLLSAAVISIFHFLRLMLGPDKLGLGVFSGNVLGNFFGQWNDLAIFFGLIAILSLTSLEGLRRNSFVTGLLYIALVISLAMLVIVNFFTVWLLVGLCALAFLLYLLTRIRFHWQRGAETASRERIFTATFVATLIVIGLCALFVFGGTAVGGRITATLHTQQLEVRPAWSTTLDIARATYGTHLLFGSGPDTFSTQWMQFRPTGLNATDFWNTPFFWGIGLVPTTLTTIGLFGALAWLLFFGTFLWSALRALLRGGRGDSFAYYLVLSSAIGTAYLWLMAVLYLPGVVTFAFAFFMTGVFAASLRLLNGAEGEWRVAFVENPRAGFAVLLGLIALIFVSAGGLYEVGVHYASNYYLQKAVLTANTSGNYDAASADVVRGLSFANTDIGHRLSAQIGIARLNLLLNPPGGQPTDPQKQESIRTQFQTLLGSTVEQGLAATHTLPQDYQNWLTLGSVYATVVPLNIEGAYDNAVHAYAEAQKRAPNNPGIVLASAQLEAAHNQLDTAASLAKHAIELKPNYTDAIFFLAQVQVAQGDLPNAIASVQAASVFQPDNAALYFQLGLLDYNAKRYEDSVAALEKAVGLSSDYSNARYFLGLSYYEVGRPQDALSQFNRVQQLNPDNEDVKRIIANLGAGQPPLPPTAATATNRTAPPIAE